MIANATRIPRLLITTAFAAGLLAAATAPSRAVFIAPCAQIGPFDTTYFTSCDWNQNLAPADSAVMGAPFWSVQFLEVAGAGPGLNLRLQHTNAPHKGDAAAAPAGGPFTHNAGPYPPGVIKGGVVVRSHANIFGVHTDIYNYHASTNALGVGSIRFLARHLEDPPAPDRLAGWSYTDPRPGRLEVSASFPSGPDQVIFNQKRPNGASNRGALPEGATDVKIRYTVGDPFFTETTFAFLVFADEGSESLSEGNLALLNRFFTDGAEYLVPMLFDPSELTNLFVAVDLTQWLSQPSPISFAIGDLFDIVGGVSPLLPGFLISTTPILFDAGLGFFSTDPVPVTMRVQVGGIIDGRNIPEPSRVVLVGLLGVLALASWSRRSRFRVAAS
ncbi:MAG: hypothetical protein WD673_15145 [Alphaproteobacteria bacterium]